MTAHPFDPRSVLLAKHAQHVVLVHFPIALFLTGVFCDMVAYWGQKPQLKPVAEFNLRAAAFIALPVLATGLLAWQWQLAGQRLKGVLLMHLTLGVCSVILCWLVVGLRARQWKADRSSLPALHGLLELAAVLVVAVTGHLGGFVSGVNLPS
jgi:uncharacterized membrane protein